MCSHDWQPKIQLPRASKAKLDFMICWLRRGISLFVCSDGREKRISCGNWLLHGTRPTPVCVKVISYKIHLASHCLPINFKLIQLPLATCYTQSPHSSFCYRNNVENEWIQTQQTQRNYNDRTCRHTLQWTCSLDRNGTHAIVCFGCNWFCISRRDNSIEKWLKIWFGANVAAVSECV